MRINLDAINDDIRTALIYGPSGAGKTALCASWPRPAWLGSAREGGYTTLANLPDGLLYEPTIKPRAYAVSSMKELLGHFNSEILPAARRGEILSVIIELSFYGDDLVRELRPLAGANGWMPFQTLVEHMIYLDSACKAVPGLRLVYNAIDNGTDGILMPGKAVEKSLPAMCDLTGYLRAEQIDKATARTLYMAPFDAHSPRHRFGTKLPPKLRNPTYRLLQALLRGEATVDEHGVIVQSQAPVPRKGLSL